MTITTVSTPGLARAIDLDAQIRSLRTEQAELLARITADAAFMDVPVRVVSSLEGHSAELGSRWHVVQQTAESIAGWLKFYAHPADQCDGLWCTNKGTPQRRKRERAADRWWQTYLGEHLLVGRTAEGAPVMIPLEVTIDRR